MVIALNKHGLFAWPSEDYKAPSHLSFPKLKRQKSLGIVPNFSFIFEIFLFSVTDKITAIGQPTGYPMHTPVKGEIRKCFVCNFIL